MIYLIIAIVFLYLMGFLSSIANWRFVIGKRTVKDTIIIACLWWGIVLLGLVAGRVK